MENILSKITTYILCLLVVMFVIFMIAPAWFIDKNPIRIVAKINEEYNVVEDINAQNYGFMIEYDTNNGSSGEIITDNCNEIYYDNDTIMYSKKAFEGSNTLSYYIIPINPKRADGLRNDVIQINEATFMKNSIRFNKVYLPDKSSL